MAKFVEEFRKWAEDLSFINFINSMPTNPAEIEAPVIREEIRFVAATFD